MSDDGSYNVKMTTLITLCCLIYRSDSHDLMQRLSTFSRLILKRERQVEINWEISGKRERRKELRERERGGERKREERAERRERGEREEREGKERG